MKQPTAAGIRPAIILAFLVFSTSYCIAQPYNHINLATDTVSQANAVDGRSAYRNIIKSGKHKTEQINLPVDKLKDIVDACAAYGVTDISVMIIALKQRDLARYRAHNNGSTATDDEIIGSQILVFRVPRAALQSAQSQKGAKINRTPSPLMTSLLAAGLRVLDQPYDDTPFLTDFMYFSFGSICPPPLSCD